MGLAGTQWTADRTFVCRERILIVISCKYKGLVGSYNGKDMKHVNLFHILFTYP